MDKGTCCLVSGLGGPSSSRRLTSLVIPDSLRSSPSLSSTIESDSPNEAHSKRRIRGTGGSHKSRHRPSVKELPSNGEIRFSTRKAAKVSNYKEDDDDDMFEDESNMITDNYWANWPDENLPAIDAVLDHRLREGTSDDIVDPGRDDFQYLIKWQNKAHVHAEWMTNAELTTRGGIRRLENYFRKVVQEDIYMKYDPDASLEEKEKWLLDRERDLDALAEHKKVERIIGEQDYESGELDYFVKWRGLSYDYCTWEDADFILGIAPESIKRYAERKSSVVQSDRSESNPTTRRPFQRIHEQPEYIKHGRLRDFQMKGFNFLAYNWCRNKNVILADEMGLGKTIQTIAFLSWLKHNRNQQGPFLIVVPLSTMPAWAESFDNWTPDINYVVYLGNEVARKTIQDFELLIDSNIRKVKFNVMLTTYECILQDSAFLSQIKWQFLAVDEAHRLKNRESLLYGKLQDFKVPSRLLITGTPMQNTLGELTALMDFLIPGMVQIDEKLDVTSEEAGQKIEELAQAIQPYMMRRTKDTVENDLPPKTEKVLRIDLADVQKEYYDNVFAKNYAALNQGAKGPKQSLLNIVMELRKASNHPLLFTNAEERILAGSETRQDRLKAIVTSSGKMMLLDGLLAKLKKDNHRVLIFSQMVQMLDILSDYLQFRGYQYQRLDGTIPAGPRRLAIDQFNAPDSNDFAFLLSTRAGGLGINLMTADTVIIFDSDWNPQADLQAMARAHRIGQTKPVKVYRFVSKDTIEEDILSRAHHKRVLEHIIIQRGITDKESKEQTDRLARASKAVAEPKNASETSLMLKSLGQKVFAQKASNQQKLEELNIDSMLENAEELQTEGPTALTAEGGEDFLKSFEYVDVKVDLEWDQIIPQDSLDQIKAEEKRKEHDQYLASVIQQNAPRKRKQADDEREERAAKKRARDAATAEAMADESDESNDHDPHRALVEKEIRNLTRALVRYGSIDDRPDELIREARLVNRSRDVLRATLDDITHVAKEKLKEDQQRIELLEQRQGKSLTKKDKKAVLFDYQGVKRLNAETIVERPGEMRMLKQVVESCLDYRDFRIPEASKVPTYDCTWDTREDGMLCVGIVRHGYGAWVQIRDDPDLGLQDKLFLEEQRVENKEKRAKEGGNGSKAPGAVHLVRRADYLLSVLKAKTSNGTNLAAKRAVENHHRNNKKKNLHPGRHSDQQSRYSASPAPPHARKQHRDSDKHRQSNSIDRHIPKRENGYTPPRSEQRSRMDKSPSVNHDNHQRQRSQDAQLMSMKLLFRPIKKDLQAVQNATPAKITDRVERANVLRQELIKIGDFVKKLCAEAMDSEWNDLRTNANKVEVSFW